MDGNLHNDAVIVRINGEERDPFFDKHQEIGNIKVYYCTEIVFVNSPYLTPFDIYTFIEKNCLRTMINLSLFHNVFFCISKLRIVLLPRDMYCWDLDETW